MIFLTAFLTGLLGSLHCIGMCGPIALALPAAGQSGSAKRYNTLFYHAGRLVSYSMLGLILGLFGFGLALAGLQQGISIAAGVVILVLALSGTSLKNKLPRFTFPGKMLANLFRKQGLHILFGIGLLNGLLPCGFVYIALIGAAAMNNPAEGSLFMFSFGLGTIPMLLAVRSSARLIPVKLRSRINRVTPFLAVLIACIFIIRGLNLGIPHLSPKISDDHKTVKSCCQPGRN